MSLFFFLSFFESSVKHICQIRNDIWGSCISFNFVLCNKRMMFFESIESRLSSVVRIESFGKCFIIPSAREARFVPCVELFKACKNRACVFCFFSSSLFFLVPLGGQTKTHIQSQI